MKKYVVIVQPVISCIHAELFIPSWIGGLTRWLWERKFADNTLNWIIWNDDFAFWTCQQSKFSSIQLKVSPLWIRLAPGAWIEQFSDSCLCHHVKMNIFFRYSVISNWYGCTRNWCQTVKSHLNPKLNDDFCIDCVLSVKTRRWVRYLVIPISSQVELDDSKPPFEYTEYALCPYDI